MHELSVAQSLIEVLAEQLAGQVVTAVDVVHVSVGQLSGVDPGALRSAFHVAAGGTIVQGAKLQITEIPPRVWCGVCNAEREVKSIQSLRCAACDTPSADLRAGRELLVERVVLT